MPQPFASHKQAPLPTRQARIAIRSACIHYLAAIAFAGVAGTASATVLISFEGLADDDYLGSSVNIPAAYDEPVFDPNVTVLDPVSSGEGEDEDEVEGENEPPVGENDAYSDPDFAPPQTSEDYFDPTLRIPAPGVLSNDTDPDNDTLSASVVNAPQNGVLTLNADGSFSYRPDGPKASHPGYDTFTYEVSDGRGGTAIATVSLTLVEPYQVGELTGGPGTPARGGVVIQGPGYWDVSSNRGEEIFVSDTAPWGTSTKLWWTCNLYSRLTSNVKTWADVSSRLDTIPDGSAWNIVLSGHSADGGILTSGGNIAEYNLDAATATLIRRKLRPGGKIILLTCHDGVMGGARRLADKVWAPVVGNTGDVYDVNYGPGNWVQFDPPLAVER